LLAKTQKSTPGQKDVQISNGGKIEGTEGFSRILLGFPRFARENQGFLGTTRSPDRRWLYAWGGISSLQGRQTGGAASWRGLRHVGFVRVGGAVFPQRAS
jgi:hypothetical protein